MEEFRLVYGLQKFKGAVNYYYPEAFIARIEKGKPAYIEKQGNDDVILSFQLQISNTPHEQALNLCRSLHPATLAAELNRGQKKPLTLDALFEDKRWSAVLKKNLHQKLIRFLNCVRQNELDLYLEVERKVYLDDIRIKFSPATLKPVLRFEKSTVGIHYSMLLDFNGSRIVPCNHDISVITESPLLIINDNVIFEVEDISGSRLKPFIKQEKIFIPDRLSAEYFEKFIKDVAMQVNIETEGFDFVETKMDARAVLRFSDSFDGSRQEVVLWFYYGQCRFSYADAQSSRIFINSNEENEILVEKVCRNSAQERKMVQVLKHLGLSETAAKRWEIVESNDKFDLFYRIINASGTLAAAGIEVDLPEHEGKSLYVGEYLMEDLSNKLNNDWFDLHMVISVGDEEIPFKALLTHIRNNDRYYHLKSGEIFIIPHAWFSRYEQLANHADLGTAIPRLAKSKHSILQHLGIELADNGIVQIDFQVPAGIQAMLRPYQRKGAEWLVNHYSNGLGACLADDMGLGKTLQTLTFLQYAKDHLEPSDATPVVQLSLFDSLQPTRKALRAIIIVPSSLVFNWLYEIRKFTPGLMAAMHTGSGRGKDVRALQEFDIIVTSYAVLLKDLDMLSKIRYTCVILDEAHYIKNRSSRIFEAVRSLNTAQRISLSGTPIENSLADLWSQMEFINPDILGSYPEFRKNYQDKIEKGKDAEALAELKLLLGPYILRRTRKEVLKDLPDLEEQVFYSVLPEEQMELFEKEKSRARNQLLNSEEAMQLNKLHVLNALLRLRQIANHPRLAYPDSTVLSGKFEDVSETIETLVKSGNKILVFSSFVSHLKLYEPELKLKNIQYVMLTGEDDPTAREKAVNKFQGDEKCSLFMISLKAGGTGLNLTAANYVLILDPWWNPFAESQAIGRSYRMGQEQKVTVIRFLAKDTIEEKIHDLQIKKRDLSVQMLDEERMPDLDAGTIEYLLQ